MAKVHNNVQETISVGGTGIITLSGAVTGYDTFTSRLSDGDECYVAIDLDTRNGDANDWEVSKCTFTTSGTTLTRDTVQESSNSDAAITVSTSHVAYIVNPAFTINNTQFEDPVAGTVKIGEGAGNNTLSGIDCTIIGSGAGVLLSSGQENTIIGKDAGNVCATGTLNTYVGKDAGKAATSSNNTAIGKDAYGGTTTHTGNGNCIMGVFTGDSLSGGDGNCLIGYQNRAASGTGRRNSVIGAESVSNSGVDYSAMLGYRLSNAYDSCIALGYRIVTTASRQCVFGNAAYATEGEVTDFYFNGITHTSGTAPTLQAVGGSGTDNAGKDINLAGGKGTGSAAGGAINFQTSTAGGSGTTLQTLATQGYVDGTDGGLVWGSPTGTSQGAGTINAVGVYDDSVLLTDYIFEIYYDGAPIEARYNNYKIKTLDEELEFIEENKHLSTMVGRKEWEEKKISQGELVSQLWATVETQALYIKEMNERIKALENDR